MDQWILSIFLSMLLLFLIMWLALIIYNRNLPQAENIPTEDFSINKKKRKKKRQCYELNRSERSRKRQPDREFDNPQKINNLAKASSNLQDRLFMNAEIILV